MTRGNLHGDIRPVNGQGTDLVRALGNPCLGPFRVHVHTVDCLEIGLLLLSEPHDGLLGELDAALCFLEFGDQFEVIRPALLVDQVVDIL